MVSASRGGRGRRGDPGSRGGRDGRSITARGSVYVLPMECWQPHQGLMVPLFYQGLI